MAKALTRVCQGSQGVSLLAFYEALEGLSVHHMLWHLRPYFPCYDVDDTPLVVLLV